MDQIKLPSKGKHKGLYVFCSKCKKHFSWTSKQTKSTNGSRIYIEPDCDFTQRKLSKCKYPEYHKYKARVNIPRSKRKMSRTFEAENYKDAVIKAINFEKEVLNMDFTTLDNTTPEKRGLKTIDNFNPEKIAYRNYLLDLEVKYLDFLDNIDVPEHQKVKRTEKHVKEILKSIELFNEAMSLANLKKDLLVFEQINDTHVGLFHSFLLKNKGYQSKTYNNKMSTLRSFFKWAINSHQLKMVNPFENVRTRSVTIKKETISKKEFNDLLQIISPDRGYTEEGKKSKQGRNRYKPYLKDAIELALHTGGRREEIVELKWNMIHEIDYNPAYISIRNLKVERQKGDGFNENVTPKIIPITKSLKLLLLRMGYENKKDTDEYLLSPDRTKTSTLGIMENLSKGFSHFYNQLNTGRNLQLKSLRKTYLTYLNSALQGDTKKLSSHSTNQVLEKHYIDETIVTKAIKNIEIFK